MKTSLRIASVTGCLTLALSATAGAATLYLTPLAAQKLVASTRTCSLAYAPAAVTLADRPELPAIAAEEHITGTTLVRIALDPDSRLTANSVLKTSGNRWIDKEALRAARASRYSSEVSNCERVGGEYALIVDFSGE